MTLFTDQPNQKKVLITILHSTVVNLMESTLQTQSGTILVTRKLLGQILRFLIVISQILNTEIAVKVGLKVKIQNGRILNGTILHGLMSRA
jgi:hypothetical protein